MHRAVRPCAQFPLLLVKLSQPQALVSQAQLPVSTMHVIERDLSSSRHCRLKKASIPEKYLLMCEGDHLFLRPMPNMMAGEAQGAALFTYINPVEVGSI